MTMSDAIDMPLARTNTRAPVVPAQVESRHIDRIVVGERVAMHLQ